MPNVLHRNLTGVDAVHPAAYVQSSDPGTVGADKIWIDTTTGPPYILKLRNAANTAWLLFASGIAGATGATGAAGATGGTGIPGAPGTTTILGAAPYVCVEDQKALGTAGGTFTSGADQTRVLNTMVADTAGIATLSGNQITLPTGRYRFSIRCPGFAVDAMQALLYDVTNAVVIKRGASHAISGGANISVDSLIIGVVTLWKTTVLEVRHRCQTTRATDGFGRAGSFGTEVYTTAQFWLEGTAPPVFGSTQPNPSLGLLPARYLVAGQGYQQHSLNTPPQ